MGVSTQRRAVASVEISREQGIALWRQIAGGRPLSLAAHYFPSARFAGIAEAWSELGSVTAALRRFGVEDYTRRITRVTARLPEEDECEHLAMPRQRPVLVTESVNVDSDGTPIEYGNTRFAADRVQLVLEP